MAIYQDPFFRRIIVPWYDSEIACLLVIFMMFLTFLFGVAGISVTRETAVFNRHLWIAVLVTLLSVGVLTSTTIRLMKRYLTRPPK